MVNLCLLWLMAAASVTPTVPTTPATTKGECEKGLQCKPREECPDFKEKESNLEALTSFTPEWLELASKLTDLQCNGETSWVCCEPAKTTGSPNEENLLLLTGGSDDISRLSSTEVFPATSGCSPQPLPGGRAFHTTFLTAGDRPEIATCGGFDDDNNYLSSCLVLEASTGQWEENRMGSLLQKRHNHAAVTLEDHAVFLIGGFGQVYLSTTTEILQAGSTTWEEGPQLPVAMGSPCAVAISATSFLVFYEKEIIEFDASIAGPRSPQSWAEEGKWPKMKTSRVRWPGCAKVGDDKVIIAGGYDGGSTLQTTEILDLNSRRISKGGKMATPRRFFHMVSFNYTRDFKTLAVGGYSGNNVLNTVEEWKPETESWSTVETRLKEKRYNFGLVATKKSLVCPSQ